MNANVVWPVLAWEALCLAGFVLSLKSMSVLRARSAYTYAGWLFTALYFVAAALKAAGVWSPPFHLEYACLALLTIAFVVAGVRREPQAEPWWWPVRA